MTQDITITEAAELVQRTGRATFTDTRGGGITAAHVLRMLRMRRTTARTTVREGQQHLVIDCHLGHWPTVINLEA
jgi:hypothetical protein